MCKDSRKDSEKADASQIEQAADAFPETRKSVLIAAAGGDWARFFSLYLQPCWREAQIQCRACNMPLTDAEDVLQEVCLRLMQSGKLRVPSIDMQAGDEQSPPVQANVPGRHLAYQKSNQPSARFRTLIKRIIVNVLMEYRRRGQLQQLPDGEPIDQFVEDSLSDVIDQVPIWRAIHEATRAFWENCTAAPDSSFRRHEFEVLRGSLVDGLSAEELAGRMDVHRTTASRALRTARERFVGLLRRYSGIDDLQELKSMVAANPAVLKEAFAQLPPDEQSQPG